MYKRQPNQTNPYQAAVLISYTVLHPILPHESLSLHGNDTVAVGSVAQPFGCSTATVLVHCGIKHVAQAVAVRVSVGQLTGVQGSVSVTVAVVVTSVV